MLNARSSEIQRNLKCAASRQKVWAPHSRRVKDWRNLRGIRYRRSAVVRRLVSKLRMQPAIDTDGLSPPFVGHSGTLDIRYPPHPPPPPRGAD